MKEPTQIAFYKKITPKQRIKRHKKIIYINRVSNLLMFTGITFLAYFLLFPIILAYAYVSPSNKILRPIPNNLISYVYNTSEESFSFEELNTKRWKPKKVTNTNIKEFRLSIPKLGIQNARVKANSTDLTPDDALGHYAGTPLPGEVGNAFIYGHSTLPILYDPKNYKTIFTKLPKLKNGDDIFINIQNKQLKYKVIYKKEMLPEKVNPYGEYFPTIYNKSTIALMTCTPPGTKKYRYIVVAELLTTE